MSSCISGGGRTYAFDIEIPKPPSPSTLSRTPHSQSPSSTLSESSNSPIAISTRKPRTPRKRPNQTYNEAATLLSMAYPKIFPPEHLPPQPCKIIARPLEGDPFLDSADMLLPFRAIDGLGCLLGPPRFEPKALLQLDPNCKMAALVCDEDRYRDGDEESRKLVGCSSPGLSRFREKCSRICGEGEQEEEEEGEDFGAESILDEEIGEGIDSIMGRQCDDDVDSNAPASYCNFLEFPDSGKFGGSGDCGFGNAAAAALRNVDREGDWWRFPTVDIREISPKLNRVSPPETEKKKDNKKKNKKKRAVSVSVSAASAGVKSCGDSAGADSIPKPTSRPNLLLKLNYEEVLRAWSDQGSPFPETFPGTESAGADDTHARLAQMDLFAEEGGGGGGLREASVMRYKEKRRTRLFSKKIRYQVRKVNADLRPRMKGRFVRRAINLKAEQEA